MKQHWIWSALACAGGAFAGCGFAGCEGPWTFQPGNADRSFTEALLHSSPETGTPGGPNQRRWRRGRRCDRSQMAEECQAFLAGRYHESLPGNRKQALPGWAWINPLAHADYDELDRLANLSPSPDDPLAFLSYLADEVLLRTSGDGVVLRRIQHDSLIPLELDLLHHPSSSDPTEIARIIRDRLDCRTNRSASPFPQGQHARDGGPATLALGHRGGRRGR